MSKAGEHEDLSVVVVEDKQNPWQDWLSRHLLTPFNVSSFRSRLRRTNLAVLPYLQ